MLLHTGIGVGIGVGTNGVLVDLGVIVATAVLVGGTFVAVWVGVEVLVGTCEGLVGL